MPLSTQCPYLNLQSIIQLSTKSKVHRWDYFTPLLIKIPLLNILTSKLHAMTYKPLSLPLFFDMLLPYCSRIFSPAPYLLTPRVEHSKNKTLFLYSVCSKLFTDTTSSKRPAAAAAAAKSLQSCPTLCDPIDGSPPGSSVPGILQARTLEWVAISFSNACMHAKSLQSCPTLCDPLDSSPPGSSVHRIL